MSFSTTTTTTTTVPQSEKKTGLDLNSVILEHVTVSRTRRGFGTNDQNSPAPPTGWINPDNSITMGLFPEQDDNTTEEEDDDLFMPHNSYIVFSGLPPETEELKKYKKILSILFYFLSPIIFIISIVLFSERHHNGWLDTILFLSCFFGLISGGIGSYYQSTRGLTGYISFCGPIIVVWFFNITSFLAFFYIFSLSFLMVTTLSLRDKLQCTWSSTLNNIDQMQPLF